MAVNPILSPRRHRVKIARSRFVGLYLQSFRVLRPILLTLGFPRSFPFALGTLALRTLALCTLATTSCKFQTTSTATVLHLSILHNEELSYKQNGSSDSSESLLATEVLQRLDTQTTGQTETGNRTIWSFRHKESQSVRGISNRQRCEDQTLLLHKTME